MDTDTQHAEPHLRAADGLNTLLKPYRSEWRRRERLSKFMEQCIRSARREDFFQVAELVSSRTAKKLVDDGYLSDAAAQLDALKRWSDDRITAYRTELLSDLTALAKDAGIPLTIDFPDFFCRKGIQGTIDFAKRTSTINGKTIKSVDPKRIVSLMVKCDRRLYGRPFHPQAFIDGLHATWASMKKSGTAVPIRDFYIQHVINQQSALFLQDMDKARYRGYSIDEFSIDLWRLASSPVSETSSGLTMELRSGRNASLWLLDQHGEKRKITSISFQKATR